MPIQALLMAGDRGASRAVRGRSKTFVEVAGKPMFVHVLESLLHTPEVSEVFVVGDPLRLEREIAEYGCLSLAAARGRPVHVVPQRESLYDNVWHTFLRTLRPGKRDDAHAVLVVPADIPLVMPEEISEFVSARRAARRRLRGRAVARGVGARAVRAARGHARHRDGVLQPARGPLPPEQPALRARAAIRQPPLRRGHVREPLPEGARQPARAGRSVLRKEWRNLWVLGCYFVIHVAGVLHRRGYIRASDVVRSWVPLATVDRAACALLRTRFTTVTTELGGAAIDIDNDDDLEVVEKMLERWKAMQARHARAA